MCVVGGDSFIAVAYDLNIVESLRSLLFKVSPSSASES